MLNTKKSITVTGNSSIDGVKAIEFKATIDSDNPQNMSTIRPIQIRLR